MKMNKLAAAALVLASAFVFTACSENVENKEYSCFARTGTYTGSWNKDMPNGDGTFTSEDGDFVVTAKWKDGAAQGNVEYKFTLIGTEFTYSGEAVTVDNQLVFQGQGHSESLRENGYKVVEEGEFKDGVLWNGTSTTFDEKGNTTVIFNVKDGERNIASEQTAD